VSLGLHKSLRGMVVRESASNDTLSVRMLNHQRQLHVLHLATNGLSACPEQQKCHVTCLHFMCAMRTLYVPHGDICEVVSLMRSQFMLVLQRSGHLDHRHLCRDYVLHGDRWL
jgi:hypothetical protein